MRACADSLAMRAAPAGRKCHQGANRSEGRLTARRTSNRNARRGDDVSAGGAHCAPAGRAQPVLCFGGLSIALELLLRPCATRVGAASAAGYTVDNPTGQPDAIDRTG